MLTAPVAGYCAAAGTTSTCHVLPVPQSCRLSPAVQPTTNQHVILQQCKAGRGKMRGASINWNEIKVMSAR